ncbi:hypothetical protein ACRRTK_016256 [Alexandromys fortis]
MGSFSITMGFFLFLAFWLPGHIGANPVYSAVSNTDLMDFKPGWFYGARGGPGTAQIFPEHELLQPHELHFQFR